VHNTVLTPNYKYLFL